MANKRPYAVLFDLDGTLIDSIGLLLACMKYSFDGRKHAPTEAEWIAGIGTPLAKQLEPFATDVEAFGELCRADWISVGERTK